MITTDTLRDAFDAIGADMRVTPIGLDFRVTHGEPGIEVLVVETQDETFFDVRVNYTRVVDLQVVELDVNERYLVLVADDWGDRVDAPARVFRCGVDRGGRLYVDAVTELSAED